MHTYLNNLPNKSKGKNNETVSSMQSGHRHFGLSGSIHLTLGELLRTTKIREIETALARVDNLSRIRILPHLWNNCWVVYGIDEE